MKKLIIIVSIACLVPFMGNAQTIEEVKAQYYDTLIQLINALTEQIQLLNEQINELLSAPKLQGQNPQVPMPTVLPTPISIEPSPTPAIKEVKKEILFNGGFCKNLRAFYLEDGKRVMAESAIFTADNGYFTGWNCFGGEAANTSGTQRMGNPLLCDTQNSTWDSKPEFSFSYWPGKNLSGDVMPNTTISITVNGVTNSTNCRN